MKDKENRIRFSVTLSPEILKRSREFSEKSGIPIARMIEKALADYIDKQERLYIE